MLRMRPYKACDAGEILSWCGDERTFRLWTLDRFGEYPVTAEDFNDFYLARNGGCQEDNFYPMTAFDDHGLAGHMMMRFLNPEKTILRFGCVIVNGQRRGKGYGKALIKLAHKYAFEILGAEKVTIGVVAGNDSAHNCYLKCGFKEIAVEKPEIYRFFGEEWKIIELEITKEEYKKLRG